MADFLNKLIQRASGQMPGIKPLVRSGYGALPVVNEWATEFEETVTFYDETGPVYPVQKPPVSQAESPEITTKSDVYETRELVKTSEEAEVRLAPDISHDSTMQEGQLSPGTARENEKPVFSERVVAPTSKTEEINPESRGQNYDDLSRSQMESLIESKAEQPGESEIEGVNRQRPVSRRSPEATVTSLENRRAFDRNFRVPAMERTQMRHQDTVETVEETWLISPDIKLPEREFLRKLETVTPAEQIRPVNLARQHRMEEVSPSVNVRVSIGRVEIKAVQQPEPQVQRRPSVPVGPVISLDAYLKSRDEEGR